MKWLINLWNWFNGKKLIIGGVCAGLSLYLFEGLLWDKWHMTWVGLTYINDVLVWAGGILMGTGAIHKGVKKTLL